MSKTPGRTAHQFFEVSHTGGFLVDLPGYGFAKVPEAMKKQWQQHLGEFLAERRTLTGRATDGRPTSDDNTRRTDVVLCRQSEHAYAPTFDQKR